MYIVKLISKKRNYFSIGKDYTESLSLVVHSDTLLSAICNNFRKIYGNNALEDFLNLIIGMEDNSEQFFRLSSCFHYIDIYRDNEYYNTIYFLPKPLIKFPFDESSQEYLEENPKILKKIQFISFEILRKLQQGQQISLSRYHVLDDIYLLDEKDLDLLGLEQFIALIDDSNAKLEIIERAIRRNITISEVVDEQKVRINRVSGESEPFTESKFKFYASKYYEKESEKEINFQLIPGFYFLLDFSGLNNEITNSIFSSIRLITDEGIGGKRSVGCGLVDEIDVKKMDENFEYFTLFNNKDTVYFTNISLVYPSVEEIEHVKFFNIYRRSGFVYSVDNNSQRFNDVNFIEEGGIFDKQIRGQLIQVASDEFITKYHKIYKNGIGAYLNVGDLEVD